MLEGAGGCLRLGIWLFLKGFKVCVRGCRLVRYGGVADMIAHETAHGGGRGRSNHESGTPCRSGLGLSALARSPMRSNRKASKLCREHLMHAFCQSIGKYECFG